jgi:uncharacterized membrane protein
MNKQQYLGILRQELKDLGPAAVTEIMSDFEEHFAVGLASGKSEDQITADLGSPKEIARQYLEGLSEGSTAKSIGQTYTWQAAGQPDAQQAVRQSPQQTPPHVMYPAAAQATPAPVAASAATPVAKGHLSVSALVLVIILNVLLGIPIWISLFATLFGCWVAAGGIGVAAVVLIILAIMQASVASLILALFALSFTALTVLAIILMVYLTKWLVIGLVHYVRWNKKLVTGGQTA